MIDKFEVMARPCNQCLMTPNRVVPARRAMLILRQCKRDDASFECHKGSIEGRHVACHNHFMTGVGQFSRICERMGMLEWIDPETLETTEPPERWRKEDKPDGL